MTTVPASLALVCLGRQRLGGTCNENVDQARTWSAFAAGRDGRRFTRARQPLEETPSSRHIVAIRQSAFGGIAFVSLYSLWRDANYVKARRDHHISNSGTEPFWTEILRSHTRRGLQAGLVLDMVDSSKPSGVHETGSASPDGMARLLTQPIPEPDSPAIVSPPGPAQPAIEASHRPRAILAFLASMTLRACTRPLPVSPTAKRDTGETCVPFPPSP